MSETDILSDWRNRIGVLATMHNKESVISPLLRQELGIAVTVPPNFDTDRFGTFTGDIKRMGNQLEAARKKAKAAMELTGTDLGFSSEGSFGSHPAIPFIQSNLEIVVLLDSKNNLEIVGHHRSGSVCARAQTVHTPEQAVEVARQWGFSEQGVILRLSGTNSRHLYKELRTEEDLRAATEKLLLESGAETVLLETDMRAHRCPGRMEAIRLATIDLIKNCRSTCPKCSTPGFVITDTIKGLQCSSCGSATDLVKETVHTCKQCSYQEVRSVGNGRLADPGECQRCNP